jgi:hypothetical protein
MRFLTAAFLGSLSLASFATDATDGPQLDKVKKGILPSGGFYSLYEVACNDGLTTTIVSTHGRSRWCTNQDGELSCFRRPQEASNMACSGTSLADRGR